MHRLKEAVPQQHSRDQEWVEPEGLRVTLHDPNAAPFARLPRNPVECRASVIFCQVQREIRVPWLILPAGSQLQRCPPAP